MNRQLCIKDAHGKVAGFREADVRIRRHAMARPVPDRFLHVNRYVPAVMPVQEVFLVHPTPGVCRLRLDERVFFFGPCTCIIRLADFAIRHAWLDARIAERMHKVATL